MAMIPAWLHVTSLMLIGLGFGCAIVIAIDEWQHPQRMWIMNVVWPLTALFGTMVWLWFYFRYGRVGSKTGNRGGDRPHRIKPFPAMVAEAASHCGSGCTLGDICAEWLAFSVPSVALWLGLGSIFSQRIFAVWVLDYIFAYGFGIIFQYYTIAPMRHFGLAQGIWAAVKADTLSLTAWQVGMYGIMAVAHFWIFRHLFGVELKVDMAEFWSTMQVAMIFGFLTSYPVNWWLLKAGLKEKM
jgi:hypothetical protein